MSAVVPTPRLYSVRNRPVAACSECARRKQKCDRDLPCQKCVTRGVGTKCSYQRTLATDDTDGPNHLTKRRKTDTRDLSPAHDSQISSLGQVLLEFSDNIGYSRHSTNALSTVNQMLNGSLPSSKPICMSSYLDLGQRVEFTRLVQNLPATETVQELVEVFFNEANWYFAVLNRYFFDVMHMKWIAFHCESKNTGTTSLEVAHFAALLLQVAALALQFLPLGHLCEESLGVRQQKERDELSERLSEAGEHLIHLLERRQPTVTSVQADLLRCAWLKNDGRGTDAWNSLGNAVRQAQELGLHLHQDLLMDASDIRAETLSALWLGEHRRRLWVTLFVWESHMSLQLGRPRMINASDCTLTPPMDCDFPLEPSRTLFRPEPDHRPSSFTLQLLKYKVGLAIHRMMSFRATSPLVEDYGIIRSLQDDFSGMLASLPPAMQLEKPETSWDLLCPELLKQRLQVSIVANSFLIALHRPHASMHVASRQQAVEAAIRSLSASHELFKQSKPHHYKIYTLVFHTVDSGIFLAAAAIKYYTAPSETRERIFRTLEQAVERLDVLQSRNAAAIPGGKVLAKCLQKFCQAWAEHIAPHAADGRENGILKSSNLVGSGTNTEVSPGAAAEGGANMPAIEYDPSLGRDLFNEITNVDYSTASWLENTDLMSMMDLRFDESDYIWDCLFPLGVN